MSVSRAQVIKIVSLCIAWYAFSSGNNIAGKTILNEFPYPMTLSMVQLVMISLTMIPFLRLWNVPSASRIPTRYWFTMIIPLAAGKFFSSVASHMSIWKVPVSYAHTVKATMPFFTVILSRIILGEKQTTRVYLSLCPIIFGVCVATVTEISFDMGGLLFALVATLGFSMQNIYSKKCLKETGVHHLRLLVILGRVCALCFFPLWLWNDATRIAQDTGFLSSPSAPRIVALLVIDGACNVGQNMVAFTMISLVSPLSYAVANATKRISIITLSLLIMRNKVTMTNILGMMIAILGVLLYNKTKYEANKAKVSETLLPTTTRNGDLHKTDSTPAVLLQDHFAKQNRIFFSPSHNGYVSQTRPQSTIHYV